MSPAEKLRRLLQQPGMLYIPACFDSLSATLVQAAGFPATFMSGFAVAGTRLAVPDTGLISYGELLDQGRNICAAVDIPVLGDGDTGPKAKTATVHHIDESKKSEDTSSDEAGDGDFVRFG